MNKELALELILAMEDAKDYSEKYDEEYEKFSKESGFYEVDKLYEIAGEFSDVPNEIFADGGTVYLSALDADTVMDRNLLTLRIRTSVPCRLSCLTLDALRSVWTDD